MLRVPSNITAPSTITVTFTAPIFGLDLTTVTSGVFNVLRRDGTTAVWAMTIVSQTASELVAQYMFTGAGEITSTGVYYLAPVFAVAGGSMPGSAVAMTVTAPGAFAPNTEESGWIGVTAAVPTGWKFPSFGPSSARPTLSLPIGYQYFDTTLGQPVFLESTNPNVWVLASAAAQPTGSGVVHVTNSSTDGAASKGTAYQTLRTNAGGTDTEWVTFPLGQAGMVSGLLPAGNQAAQTIGGDGSGTTANLTVTKIQGQAIETGVPLDGEVLTWSTANLRWQPETPVAFMPGGDLTGNATSQTVARINGSTVPAGGGLTIGNLLQVTSSAALVYAALNLAGGANYVTGLLPTANQVAQTMTGDVTGNTGANTVAKVNGAAVPAAGSLTTGNAAYVSGGSALTYSALNLAGGAGWVTGTLPASNQASQTMAGDVTGNTGASVVAKATGSSGTFALASTAALIQWASTTITPSLAMATHATTPQLLTLQAANVTTGTGSALSLLAGTGTTAGGLVLVQGGNATTTGGGVTITSGTGVTAGNVLLQTGGVTALTCAPGGLSSTLSITTTSFITVGAGGSTPTTGLIRACTAIPTGNTNNNIICARYNGTTDYPLLSISTSTALVFGADYQGNGTHPSGMQFWIAAGSTYAFVINGATAFTMAGALITSAQPISFAAALTTPSLNHIQNTTTTGVNFPITAQVGASGFASGDLQIGGGAAAGGGGASAAGFIDFRNQTIATSGTAYVGGATIPVTVGFLPVKIGGSTYKLVVVQT